ncbi:bifunctional diguanylate cyclase/phosphodiesterase [Allohahella marinimesophila]|uniref:PAS domain S-box-containing protein/diguanylate cyclase (GGDEF)-like protein n=1 Tax=Allohahella marinimesophila TaxID=1054972 RepID=A0ABP7NLB0_9GAMM
MVVSSLLMLTGICIMASVAHALAALRRPYDPTQGLFAGMCLAVVAYGISQVVCFTSYDEAAYLLGLKVNIFSVCIFFAFYGPFIQRYTGRGSIRLLQVVSAIYAVLAIINLSKDHSLQFDSVIELYQFELPWAESVTLAAGSISLSMKVAVLLTFCVLLYGVYALTRLWWQTRSGAVIAMLCAALLFLAATVQGAMVRLGLMDFIHLAPFVFLLMPLIMGTALNRESFQRLQASERRFRSLVEQSPFSIQVLTPDGKTRQVNSAWEQLWGLTKEDMASHQLLEDPQLIEKGAMPYLLKGFGGVATEIPPLVYNPAEDPYLEGPSRDRWVAAYIYPIKDGSGDISDVILMHQDVTDKKRTDDAMQLVATAVSSSTVDEFFDKLVVNIAQVFDASDAFIAVTDDRLENTLRTLAWSASGRLVGERLIPLEASACKEVLQIGQSKYFHEVRQDYPQDSLLSDLGTTDFIATPLRDARGKVIGLIALSDTRPLMHVEENTRILEIFAARAESELQRQQAEAHIRHMAYHDYLTGLPNRGQLQEWLSEANDTTAAVEPQNALLLIDLDHFKTINDALGHEVGDGLLQSVARRLQDIAGADARVARLGGDEFVVMLTVEGSAQLAAVKLAEGILEGLSQLLYVGERTFSVGASIGVALFPIAGSGEADILRHADLALYEAKKSGRGTINLFRPALQAAVANRLQLEEGLRNALGNGELQLRFQPQLGRSVGVIGAEVLLRWRHPELGYVSPVDFIPVAEETGGIHAIGTWVLTESCRHLSEWARQAVPFTGHLSINVSAWQFSRPDFVSQVFAALADYQVPPQRLMLELTESALLYDLQETIEKLRALRNHGVGIALDDFGTGYSSLAYLRDLPLDQLKIDKSFIAELSGEMEHPLVESIIDIGRNMGLVVVAEGVETGYHCQRLIELGCESFQGYLFARPLTEEDFRDWLEEEHSVVSFEQMLPMRRQDPTPTTRS